MIFHKRNWKAAMEILLIRGFILPANSIPMPAVRMVGVFHQFLLSFQIPMEKCLQQCMTGAYIKAFLLQDKSCQRQAKLLLQMNWRIWQLSLCRIYYRKGLEPQSRAVPLCLLQQIIKILRLITILQTH